MPRSIRFQFLNRWAHSGATITESSVNVLGDIPELIFDGDWYWWPKEGWLSYEQMLKRAIIAP